MKKIILRSLIPCLLVSQVWAVNVTLSPLYTVIGLLRTILAAPTLTAAGTVGSSAYTSEEGKDQVALAKPDAKAYLDHGVMSDDLAEIIVQLRQMDELSQYSDADIALAIYTYDLR